MSIKTALTILELEMPFSLIELKSAYRKMALKYHPDCGGTKEAFIKIDEAYDYLKTFSHCKTEKGSAKFDTAEWWEEYWSDRLVALTKEFKKEWREAYKQVKQEKLGLWFNTTIKRFERKYFEPKTEWFAGALFGKKPSQQLKEDYRNFLLSVAPNSKFAESWAKKYYELEFSSGWVFYLSGSVQQVCDESELTLILISQ